MTMTNTLASQGHAHIYGVGVYVYVWDSRTRIACNGEIIAGSYDVPSGKEKSCSGRRHVGVEPRGILIYCRTLLYGGRNYLSQQSESQMVSLGRPKINHLHSPENTLYLHYTFINYFTFISYN